MSLFARSNRKPFNAAWADFRGRGAAAVTVPETLRGPSDAAAVLKAAQSTPIQPPIRLFFRGPEVAGANMPLPDHRTLPRGVTEDIILVQRSLLMLQALVGTMGVDRAYGGWWSQPGNGQASTVLWVEYGDARLCVVPQLQLGTLDIAMSFSHCILWRQPWMTEHEHDDFGWADLSTNYQEHVGDGGTYWEAESSWHKGERLWTKNFFGVRFDGRYGSPVVRHPNSFNSFYHFAVGDLPFTPGSPAGQDLRRVRQLMSQLSQLWGTFGQMSQAVDKAAPDAHRGERIRQQED